MFSVIRPRIFAFSNIRMVRLMATGEAKPEGSSSANPQSRTHKVDNFERKLLVWSGRYKSANEVPDYINQEVMDKTRNKMRIKLANYMIVLTILGCIYMIYSGKQAAGRGESVQKANLDWHKEYNDKRRAEEEAKKGK